MGETTTPEAPKDEAKPEATPEAKPEASAPAKSGGMPDYIRFPLVLGIVSGVAALGLAGLYGLTKKKMDEAEGRKIQGAFASVLGDEFKEAAKKTYVKKAAEGEKPVEVEYYELTGLEGQRVALAIQATCPGSYNAGEPIKLMVVVDDGIRAVRGVRVIASKETPGFGDRINDPVATNSLLGIIAGKDEKSRVVTKSSGAVVGIMQKNDDGSFIVARTGEEDLKVDASDVASQTAAPFPPAFVDQFTGVAVDDAKLGKKIDALTGATITSRAVAGGVAAAIEQLREIAAGR